MIPLCAAQAVSGAKLSFNEPISGSQFSLDNPLLDVPVNGLFIHDKKYIPNVLFVSNYFFIKYTWYTFFLTSNFPFYIVTGTGGESLSKNMEEWL
jgi:hypothetical protein